MELDPQAPHGTTPPEGGGVPTSDRGELLGRDWSSSEDTIHTVLTGYDGIQVLEARESDGYEWKFLADLPTPTLESDLWVANSCVSSSREHMMVVYAPRAASNDEALFSGGAFAALVDLTDGTVEDLGAGYSLAYFNPGCGSGDTAAITRSEPDTGVTKIASVDMATGEVLQRVEIDGMATSAISAADGDVMAVTGDGVQTFSEGQAPQTLVADNGRLHGLTLDDDGRLGYIAVAEDTSTAYLLETDALAPTPRAVAEGPVEEVALLPAADGFYVTGDNVDVEPGVAGVESLPAARPDAVVSSHGHLVVEEVIPEGLGGTADPDAPEVDSTATITAHLTHSAEDVDFELTELAPAPTRATQEEAPTSGRATVHGSPAEERSSVQWEAGDPHDPVEAERYCAIPRNDPANQAYQPKPRQVEWAVNRAVKGELTELRPANWRNLGMSSYRPQSMFPRVALAGGGTIPSQVVLAVLMQESNLWQASRYTGPGNTGNPLTGDYYGNRGKSSIWDVTFPDSDCGYGIGQITDGMRLVGHEKTDDYGNKTETSLPYAQQRAIALDYTANISMAVRMLAQKWNETRAAGMIVNNGDPSKIENWFFATWAYNSGFYPDKGDDSPWGVGWFNNPVNPNYPAHRALFMSAGPGDAAKPQDWPYPEKVIGWAAYGTSLPETQYANPDSRTYVYHYESSYRTASWPTDGMRAAAPPPIDHFCDPDVNECNPTQASAPCQRGDYKCWWHGPVVWNDNCARECGVGFERFPSSYATEASSMASTLPEITRRSSNRANCAAPPVPMIVVDDTKQRNARNAGECAHRSTAGTFEFTFEKQGANGSYPAKVDLHQQGGGYNGHFYHSHMQAGPKSLWYKEQDGYMSGRWEHPSDMTGRWVRVWVHLPDYAAWTQQAPYTIDLGNGEQQTRHLPQRRYENSWVSLGVFEMKGKPSVELSNVLTSDIDPLLEIGSSDNFEWVAWDAVGFETLPGKPDDVVVALGDSYASGEGAGDYAAWSDNNGTNPLARNACHQSANSWIHKTTIPGSGATIGARADAFDQDLDFQFVACSGAQTEHLLPFHSATGPPPLNGERETGQFGQYATVNQLDAGYLDENTTLVTISIGGNDMRFGPILKACIMRGLLPGEIGSCWDTVLENDEDLAGTESQNRLENEVPGSLATVLEEVHDRAPNADIALFGYPSLFEAGGQCVSIDQLNTPWLNNVTDGLNDVIRQAALDADSATPSSVDVFFVDVRKQFKGRAVCDDDNAINRLVATLTPGDKPVLDPLPLGASAESVHPNQAGTTLYANALNEMLALP